MSSPTVNTEWSSGTRKPWGLSLFFKLDGKKLTLRQERVAWSAAVFFTLFAGWQLAGGEEGATPSNSVRKVLAQSAKELVRIPQFGGENQPSVSQGMRRISATAVELSAPQLIPRPRDLSRIPPGSLIKAVLVTGASNGPVKAKLTETLFVDGDPLLEEGAVLLGVGSSTEERLMVTFNQIIFKDGSFTTLQAHACDSGDRIVGLKGSKVGDKAISLAGSIGLGFIGGMSEGLQDVQGQQGVAVRPPTVRNALLHATATTALEQSTNLMRDLKTRQPIIEVAQGTAILLLVGGQP